MCDCKKLDCGCNDPLTVPVGENGEQGLYGGFSSDWIFKSGYSAVASKQLKLNNADPSLVTEIKVHDTNKTGNNNSEFLLSLANDDNFGLIRLFKIDDSTKYSYYKITAVTDEGGYFTITVEYIDHYNTFSDGDNVVLTFSPKGEDGSNGTNGDDGLGYKATTTTPVADAALPYTINITTQTDLAYTSGARVRLSDSGDPTMFLEGLVTSYNIATGDMVIDVDLEEFSGTISSWNINLAGEPGEPGVSGGLGSNGADGADGINAYTTLTSDGVFAAPNWTFTVTTGEEAWLGADQIVYIEDAGYYRFLSNIANTLTVSPLGYPSENTANILTGKKLSPAGVRGEQGTVGFTYETIDGNSIPAEATGNYQFLMRKGDNTGYTFISLVELKALLGSI